MAISIEECRRILGSVAANMTDAEVEAERDHMEALATAVFDQFASEMERDSERMNWLLYAHQTGEVE